MQVINVPARASAWHGGESGYEYRWTGHEIPPTVVPGSFQPTFDCSVIPKTISGIALVQISYGLFNKGVGLVFPTNIQVLDGLGGKGFWFSNLDGDQQGPTWLDYSATDTDVWQEVCAWVTGNAGNGTQRLNGPVVIQPGGPPLVYWDIFTGPGAIKITCA